MSIGGVHIPPGSTRPWTPLSTESPTFLQLPLVYYTCLLYVLKVLPGDKACRTSQPGVPVPLVVGVALRGVQAMAVSAKGFEGLGPVFRVDATLDAHGTPQAQVGEVSRHLEINDESKGGHVRPPALMFS